MAALVILQSTHRETSHWISGILLFWGDHQWSYRCSNMKARAAAERVLIHPMAIFRRTTREGNWSQKNWRGVIQVILCFTLQTMGTRRFWLLNMPSSTNTAGIILGVCQLRPNSFCLSRITSSIIKRNVWSAVECVFVLVFTLLLLGVSQLPAGCVQVWLVTSQKIDRGSSLVVVIPCCRLVV